MKKTKDNNLTLKYDNIYLHSKYNPIREAERLIDKKQLENSSCVLILGIGIGYHIDYIRKLNNNIKIFGIELDQSLSIYSKNISNFRSIYSKNINKINEFIWNEIDDFDTSKIYFVELPSYKGIHSDIYNSVYQNILTIIKQKMQSYTTTLGFARQWQLNFIKNISYNSNIECLKEIKTTNADIFILASGPTLISDIKKNINHLKKAIIVSFFTIFACTY